jgi:D-arabinose 1-dehydrogenase-like Zn-dependent alcohol dehydrogenase
MDTYFRVSTCKKVSTKIPLYQQKTKYKIMKITVTGSLGNIGKHLVKILVANSNEVTVISSNEDRKSAIEALGAQAAIGSITDTDFLVKTFTVLMRYM